MAAKIAYAKAGALLRARFWTLWLTCAACRGVGLLLTAAANGIVLLTGSAALYIPAVFVTAFCCVPFALWQIGRAKTRLTGRPARLTPAPVLIASAAYAALRTAAVAVSGVAALAATISALSFVVEVYFLPFYGFALLTGSGGVKASFTRTGALIRRHGVDYLKLLLRMLPLYLASTLIVALPARPLTGLLAARFEPAAARILMAAYTATASLVAVLPAYTDARLYAAIYYLLEG